MRPVSLGVLKIYTGTGDDGSTGLKDGSRISKSSARIQAYGAVDEANSAIGLILANNIDRDISSLLLQVQSDLFVIGADLSDTTESQENRTVAKMVSNLEHAIDRYESELQPLANFILPGGDRAAAICHLARTTSRRAEACTVALAEHEKISRHCTAYLNRLSDLLFVLARVINRRCDIADTVWKP